MLESKVTYPNGKPEPGLDVLWRAEVKSYAYCVNPDFDEWASTAPRLELRWHAVMKRTPCGARLSRNKLVLLGRGKEWASETPERAIQQLIDRRRAQIYIVGRQLRRAKEDLGLAEAANNEFMALATTG